MNKRISIEERTSGSPAKNTFGEKNVVWEEFKSVWAEVSPIVGREYWAQQQIQSEVTHKIRIRYREGVTSDMRIAYGPRIFAIKSVIDVEERHKEMVLMCAEGVENE